MTQSSRPAGDGDTLATLRKRVLVRPGLRRLLRRPFAHLLKRRALRPFVWLLAWCLILLARLERQPRGLVVVYHGVAAGAAMPGVAPVVARTQLERDVAAFARHFRLVGLEQLGVALAARRRRGRIPLAMTFDDDLLSHVDVALPVLCHAGVTATFFVGGDESACERAYWWEPLQLALDRAIELPDEHLATVAREPSRLAAAMLALPAARRDALAAALWARLAPARPPRHLSRMGIASLARAGHGIGFHTRDHALLTELAPPALAEALTDGLAAVAEAAGGRAVRMIAYPYGRSDPAVRAAAAAAGFTHGYTTRPCAVTPASDPMSIGRVDAAAGSSALLALRLARALRTEPEDQVR